VVAAPRLVRAARGGDLLRPAVAAAGVCGPPGRLTRPNHGSCRGWYHADRQPGALQYTVMWPDCPPVAAASPGSLIKKFRAHSSPVFTLPAAAPANQPNSARRCGGGLSTMWSSCGGLLSAPLDGFLRDYRRCRCHRPRGPAHMRRHRSQADAARAMIPPGSRSPPAPRSWRGPPSRSQSRGAARPRFPPPAVSCTCISTARPPRTSPPSLPGTRTGKPD
jgi:hypothetical protein